MKEIDYIVHLLKIATRDREIIKRLNFFYGFEGKPLQRWENWFQMELLYKLKNDGAKYLTFEDAYDHDKRKWLPSSKCDSNSARIDIAYQRPYSRPRGYLTALELKVNDCPINSIRSSLIDLSRIRAFRRNQWCFKAVFSVSMYRTQKRSKYIDIANDNGAIIDVGPYKAAIMGWEVDTEENATLANYEYWLKEVLRHKRF